MSSYPFKYIDTGLSDQVAFVWLNRPKKHNALNIELIQELVAFFSNIEKEKHIRAIVIRGKGKSFSSGADLDWFKKSVDNSNKTNYQENNLLSTCFSTIYNSNKPVITIVKGNALGGALGIISASDITLGTESSKFAFSEVKLGLVPATISPYAIKRIGEFNAKYYMLTGKTFNGTEAKKIGLLNEVCHDDEIEHLLQQTLDSIQKASPNALVKCKSMLNTVSNSNLDKNIIEYTIEQISDIKNSEEAQEGIKAFLEKRQPYWILK